MNDDETPTCRCGQDVMSMWANWLDRRTYLDRCEACIWQDAIWRRAPLPDGVTAHCKGSRRRGGHLGDSGCCLRCGYTPETPTWLPKPLKFGPDGYPVLPPRKSDKQYLAAFKWLPAGGAYAAFAKTLPAARRRLGLAA